VVSGAGDGPAIEFAEESSRHAEHNNRSAPRF